MDERWAREVLVRALASEGVADSRVLEALGRVPRERLLPAGVPPWLAYEDRPLPIGCGQTISQPRVVAMMTHLARIAPGDRVLEVGTGSGYQAAVLAELGARVWSIEAIPSLAERARRALGALGYADRITLRVGDGHQGWPEEAPFDAILVTAAPRAIPAALLEQLVDGGRLVIPVGEDEQVLVVVEREGDTFVERPVASVRFVPMVALPSAPENERPA